MSKKSKKISAEHETWYNLSHSDSAKSDFDRSTRQKHIRNVKNKLLSREIDIFRMTHLETQHKCDGSRWKCWVWSNSMQLRGGNGCRWIVH